MLFCMATPLRCWFLLLAAAAVLLTPDINDKSFTSFETQLLYNEHHCPLKGKWVSLLPPLLLPLSPSSPAKAAVLLL